MGCYSGGRDGAGGIDFVVLVYFQCGIWFCGMGILRKHRGASNAFGFGWMD